ncbi:MAG: hypothetical protein WKF85_02455 [Chitinophagaceae bacterium]
MKKVLTITIILSGLLTACADNSTNESVNSTDTIQTMKVDSPVVMTVDSTKASKEKRVKDSTDAAHGHTH